MIIRNEKKEDEFVVESLIRKAFWNVHEPGCTEHYMAHKMREHEDFIEALDMVAEMDGKIVGNIMYTLGNLISEDGDCKSCLSFGPISIDPEYKRRGIGKKLIETSFERAIELGYDCVVIFGHPSNYVSRGFVSCKKMNVSIGDDCYPTAMLIKILTGDPLEGKKWIYEQSEACSFEREDAEEYDKRFPYMEKKVESSQEEYYIYSHSCIQD